MTKCGDHKNKIGVFTEVIAKLKPGHRFCDQSVEQA